MKQLAAVLLIGMLLGGAAEAASFSASYRITTENIGNTRDRQIAVQSSASFALNAGFFKSAYFGGVSPILAPVVIVITPSSATNTGPVSITNLGGANFQPGATVRLSKAGQTDINATNVEVVNAGWITCTFDLTGADGGAWDVTVTNSDGRSGSLAGAFTINLAAPTVSAITPASGTNNGPVNITALAGTNFRAGAVVRLTQTGQNDIVATAVAVVSATNITCTFDLTGKVSGRWNVVVTNSDGQSGTLAAGFKVETPTVSVVRPVVSSANPFNPSAGATSINYSLSKDSNIVIYVYNIRGERVWQYNAPAGSRGGSVGDNSITWDGMTAYQAFVSSGVYFVDVTTTDGGYKLLSRTKVAVVK